MKRKPLPIAFTGQIAAGWRRDWLTKQNFNLTEWLLDYGGERFIVIDISWKYWTERSREEHDNSQWLCTDSYVVSSNCVWGVQKELLNMSGSLSKILRTLCSKSLNLNPPGEHATVEPATIKVWTRRCQHYFVSGGNVWLSVGGLQGWYLSLLWFDQKWSSRFDTFVKNCKRINNVLW